MGCLLQYSFYFMNGSSSGASIQSIADSISTLESISRRLLSLPGLLNRTWRIYYISTLHEMCVQQDFVDRLIPLLKSHFQRRATSIDNFRLRDLVIREVDDIQGVAG